MRHNSRPVFSVLGWVCLHWQDISREIYRVDGNTGPGGPTASSATGSLKRFFLDIWHLTLIGELGGCPLTSHKAGRQAGGLHVPDW